MKTLKQLCEPRASVFDATRRDTVLNLSHLTDPHGIDASAFFDENFVTDGMKVLLTEAFRRLQGRGEQAIFKLTQAMGGGKTHNLLALGLLARQPGLRAFLDLGLPTPADLGEVRVVAFSGRETDVPHGLWGEIAAQVGRKDLFAPYFTPLQAPGRSAWVNLLKGRPTLILLDELPPYLDNARSISVGNSDLARVTATALANLFEALADDELRNVCLVMTDLVGTYADASAQIGSLLSQVQGEAQRRAMSLTPVQINTDEFYQILRKRLFATLPAESEIGLVAQAYAKAVRDARQMDITTQSPEQTAQQISSSYPFHPAIKDLYARFRENPGFQQTRALIRLMRIITARLWESGEADLKHLISVQDLDLNDPETLSEIRQINPSLENAIAHDIAAQGKAVAEVMDANLGAHDTRDASVLIFVASLANVPSAVLGLTIPELVGYLCGPGRDLAKLKGDVLEKLATAAWYLHSNRDGRLFFRNVENLNAKLESLAGTYLREQSYKELRQRLESMFTPQTRWCYQDVLPLPAPDEIALTQDRVTLVISEPWSGQGLNPKLREFWEQTTFQNRVLFLTGSRDTFEGLMTCASRLKAIQHILDEMSRDRVAETDPQRQQAGDLQDRLVTQLVSAVKETFSTLYYPTRQSSLDTLLAADFTMRYSNNRYNGEEQIVEVLKQRKKYEEDISSTTFRQKVEARLLTTPVMLWSDVKRRAATNVLWQWHRTDALDVLKADLIHKEMWQEEPGGYVNRSGPPPKTATPQIQERSRDETTGEVELRVTPVNGDTVFAEVGGVATPASKKVANGLFRTTEMKVSFVATDSTGAHPSGPAVSWQNKLTLRRSKLFGGPSGERRLELQAAPSPHGEAEIRYTTDGSDPRLGGVYDGAITIGRDVLVVRALASRDGIESEPLEISISWDQPDSEKPIDATRPVTWSRRHDLTSTLESYAFIDRIEKLSARVSGAKVVVTGSRWVELAMDGKLELTASALREAADFLRRILGAEGQLSIEVERLHFDRGQGLLDWVGDERTEIRSMEVKQ